MKKIRTSTVAILCIVTLGVYGVVWLALRRNEIAHQHKIKLPSIAWIIVSAALILLSVAAMAVMVLLAALGVIDINALALWMTLVPAGVGFFIGLWWMIKFGRAISDLTAGRVPLWWTVIFYIFLGGYVVPVYQYYVNRQPKKSSAIPKRVGPTRRFVVISVVAIVVFTTLEVVNLVELPNALSSFENDIGRTEELIRKANELTAKYDACIANLEVDYPG